MTARPGDPAPAPTAQPPAQPTEPVPGRDPGYRAGYEDGFATGVEIGWAWAEREMAEEWRAVAAHVRRSASRPTHAELQHRRNQYPTPARTPEEILALTRASWASYEAEA